MKNKIRRLGFKGGNSFGFTIPREVIEDLGWHEDTYVRFGVGESRSEGGRTDKVMMVFAVPGTGGLARPVMVVDPDEGTVRTHVNDGHEHKNDSVADSTTPDGAQTDSDYDEDGDDADSTDQQYGYSGIPAGP